MRKFAIAATALLFGTSAYAMVPSMNGVPAQDPYAVDPALGVTPFYDGTPVLQPASSSWWSAEPVAYTADKADATSKAGDDLKGDAKLADKADAPLVPDEAGFKAAAVAKMEAMGMAEPAPATESADMTGTGGPYEPVATASADLTARPAAQNYPACRPGPGDDNCIQLYEPGVREQLAAWSQPTGGFAGSGETRVAMGGPYEPVADEAVVHEMAMNGDGAVDPSLGEAATDEDVGEV